MTDAERRAALRAILRSGPAALSRPGALPRLTRAAEVHPPVATAARSPLIEVFDDGNELLIVADLPGVVAADLRPTLDGRTLTCGPASVALPRDVQMPPQSVVLRNGIVEIRLEVLRERAVGG